jgi:hypothetical protein
MNADVDGGLNASCDQIVRLLIECYFGYLLESNDGILVIQLDSTGMI